MIAVLNTYRYEKTPIGNVYTYGSEQQEYYNSIPQHH